MVTGPLPERFENCTRIWPPPSETCVPMLPLALGAPCDADGPGDGTRSRDLEAGPDDPARSRRLEWAKLLQRVWRLDVLVCPSCKGSMRLIAVIEDQRVAHRILEHLGLPSRAPPRGRSTWRGQQSLPVHDPFTVDPPYVDD